MGGSASTGTEETLLLTETFRLGIFLGSTVLPLAFVGEQGVFQLIVLPG